MISTIKLNSEISHLMTQKFNPVYQMNRQSFDEEKYEKEMIFFLELTRIAKSHKDAFGDQVNLGQNFKALTEIAHHIRDSRIDPQLMDYLEFNKDEASGYTTILFTPNKFLPEISKAVLAELVKVKLFTSYNLPEDEYTALVDSVNKTVQSIQQLFA